MGMNLEFLTLMVVLQLYRRRSLFMGNILKYSGVMGQQVSNLFSNGFRKKSSLRYYWNFSVRWKLFPKKRLKDVCISLKVLLGLKKFLLTFFSH